MPAHLRVSVPDRPGSLAALTTALASVGANVLAVTVIDHDNGRAVDDLILDWPYERPPDALLAAVERCKGARVHGLRHLRMPATSNDADLVAQIMRAPARAIETVVDALP